MSIEFKTDPNQELSEPEKQLESLRTKMWELNRHLMATFFQEDTWTVRQGGAYGLSLLEVRENSEEEWERQDKFVEKILKDLGPKIAYFEAAYSFPDNLAAFVIGADSDLVDIKSQRTGQTKEKVAKATLENTLNNLKEEKEDFYRFLESDVFKQAFKIKVHREKEDYTISNLELDASELKKATDRLFD